MKKVKIFGHYYHFTTFGLARIDHIKWLLLNRQKFLLEDWFLILWKESLAIEEREFDSREIAS